MTLLLPAEPAARDFVIECFLEDWSAGRAARQDGERLKAQLRAMGDVARLETVARRLSA
jgi:hypothetical protein